MAALTLKQKLAILADAAKYDASCASSGGAKRNSINGKGIGSTDGGMGICHAYTPDGRCVSLLKLLLTNFCVFDCAYCINRVSSNVPRARFNVDEVVRLTLDFYKRNYIEGLFLSSGVIRSPDATQEEMNEVARRLREVHDFRGYIHLKLVAGASPELAAKAGLYADRLSANIELPTEESLSALAPEKDSGLIKRTMGAVRLGLEARTDKARKAKAPRYAPAGQSTQMIIGADAATDADILTRADNLYGGYRLKRVYYSAFSPIPDSSAALPSRRPPMVREHRLYQADWLIRVYGFGRREVTDALPGGMLSVDHDPKTSFALANRHLFPVDVNTADREMLLRTPGLGVRTVDRLLGLRRIKRLVLEDVRILAGSVRQAKAFIITADWKGGGLLDQLALPDRLAEPVQLSLFERV